MIEGDDLGPYRVLRRIGAGGMGEVWLAEHGALGRRAAIKVLHPELASRTEIVTRFFNEARAAAAIADPGIVQIFDFGHGRDGSAYIVMELLEGEPLDRRLQRLGAVPVRDALRLMRQVAASLGAAHARGIVHRDLKPENIFIVLDPEVPGGERAKIVDFGIAKLAASPAHAKTQTSAILGTPAYMSPEQCRGAGQVDRRSDVYSFGCVLFTLVTGQPPFAADGPGDLIAMHLREPAPRASSIVPAIPHAVDELVARCLAKDPDERFASATELAAAIGRIDPVALGASQAATPSVVLPAAPTTLSSVAGSCETAVAKPRGRWLLVGAAAAAIGGAIVFAVVTRAGSTPEPAPPQREPQLPAVELTVRDVQAGFAQVVAWSTQLGDGLDQIAAWTHANTVIAPPVRPKKPLVHPKQPPSPLRGSDGIPDIRIQ